MVYRMVLTDLLTYLLTYSMECRKLKKHNKHNTSFRTSALSILHLCSTTLRIYMAHFRSKSRSSRRLRQKKIKQRIYIQREKNNGDHELKRSTGAWRTIRVHRNAQRLIRLRPRLLIPRFFLIYPAVVYFPCL